MLAHQARANQLRYPARPCRIAAGDRPGETSHARSDAFLLFIVRRLAAFPQMVLHDLLEQLRHAAPLAPRGVLQARLEGRRDAPAIDGALVPHALHGSALTRDGSS